MVLRACDPPPNRRLDNPGVAIQPKVRSRPCQLVSLPSDHLNPRVLPENLSRFFDDPDDPVDVRLDEEPPSQPKHVDVRAEDLVRSDLDLV
jgi:hypothetical protein